MLFQVWVSFRESSASTTQRTRQGQHPQQRYYHHCLDTITNKPSMDRKSGALITESLIRASITYRGSKQRQKRQWSGSGVAGTMAEAALGENTPAVCERNRATQLGQRFAGDNGGEGGEGTVAARRWMHGEDDKGHPREKSKRRFALVEEKEGLWWKRKL
ncbi:hypothetical protein LR48_Vigan48s000200 [Vigna angularis]|uniref:Uncharacterized protein n=1 Tax=Phaseolus angularis TaxID=3914 RepID=A0A0L9T4P5_PHAAN|nr:hypothetical protein LR48_Vigan48s000200 [Vigna angularis]